MRAPTGLGCTGSHGEGVAGCLADLLSRYHPLNSADHSAVEGAIRLPPLYRQAPYRLHAGEEEPRRECSPVDLHGNRPFRFIDTHLRQAPRQILIGHIPPLQFGLEEPFGASRPSILGIHVFLSTNSF